MAREINFETTRTFATAANARKAVAKVPMLAEDNNLRYFIHQREDGRFLPVFVGQQAVQAGAHFHFTVVG